MSSATDVKAGTGGSSAGEPLGSLGSSRSACLAEEISVNATGTRPGTGPDKRELFTEETATVLIFPDGAVIKLSAAVATGQLIFLTNKNTNMEVVSQVVGKRVYKPTSCYVELRFTEEIAGFWGVEIPAKSAEKPQARPDAAAEEGADGEAVEELPVAEESVEEQVDSAESTEDSDAPAAPAPTDKEVERVARRSGSAAAAVGRIEKSRGRSEIGGEDGRTEGERAGLAKCGRTDRGRGEEGDSRFGE